MYTGFQFLFKSSNIADLFSERFLGKRFYCQALLPVRAGRVPHHPGLQSWTVLSQEMGEGAFCRVMAFSKCKEASGDEAAVAGFMRRYTVGITKYTKLREAV